MKNKYTAGILAFFFGAFGTHKFYLEKTSSGFFRLGLFIFFMMAAGGFGRFVVTTLAVLGVVEAIILFAMGEKEFDEKYNGERKGRRREKRQARHKRRDTDFDRRERRFEPRSRYEERGKSPGQAQQQRRYRQVKHNPHKKSGIQKYKEYDYKGAIADFQKALKIAPNDIATHFNLACAYSLTEETEKSLNHLDAAVKLGFDDFDRIREHDAFAFLRVQAEYEAFADNNFRLPEEKKEEEKQEETSAPPQLESPKQDLLNEIADEDNLLEQLKMLGELREKGILTDEEFSAQKKKLLR
jgi:TM2 domain-containing membrane protein YozV